MPYQDTGTYREVETTSLGVDQQFKLNITTDESGKMVTGFTWEKIPA